MFQMKLFPFIVFRFWLGMDEQLMNQFCFLNKSKIKYDRSNLLFLDTTSYSDRFSFILHSFIENIKRIESIDFDES